MQSAILTTAKQIAGSARTAESKRRRGKAASDARKALAVKLSEDVKSGAEEAFVRAACAESGVCSQEFTDRLCAKLFPKEVQG